MPSDHQPRFGSGSSRGVSDREITGVSLLGSGAALGGVAADRSWGRRVGRIERVAGKVADHQRYWSDWPGMKAKGLAFRAEADAYGRDMAGLVNRSRVATGEEKRILDAKLAKRPEELAEKYRVSREMLREAAEYRGEHERWGRKLDSLRGAARRVKLTRAGIAGAAGVSAAAGLGVLASGVKRPMEKADRSFSDRVRDPRVLLASGGVLGAAGGAALGQGFRDRRVGRNLVLSSQQALPLLPQAEARYAMANHNETFVRQKLARLRPVEKPSPFHPHGIWEDPTFRAVEDPLELDADWKQARANVKRDKQELDHLYRRTEGGLKGHRLLRRSVPLRVAGVAGLAGGAALGVGGLVGLERRKNAKKSASRGVVSGDRFARGPKVNTRDEGESYRRRSNVSGGLLQDSRGVSMRPKKPVDPRQREYLIRHGFVDDGDSEDSVRGAIRRARLSGQPLSWSGV